MLWNKGSALVRMTGSINVKKIDSTVENVDGCKSAIKAIIPLKESMAATLLWNKQYHCWNIHSNNE